MKLAWDLIGERRYETGVDHGVLYLPNNGVYSEGVAWSGLTNVTESPSGAEATPQYADNMVYLNLVSAETFGGTIEAITYPDEFARCDGSEEPTAGVKVGQQNRHPFGFCYRTRVGSDTDPDLGYKIHIVYNALAAPSEKAHTTVNDTPEAMPFSWTISTTPIPVETGGLKPTSTLEIDSTKVDPDNLAALEAALYGTDGTDPRLPLPDEVLGMFADELVSVAPVEPDFVAATGTITIPEVAGVVYRRADTDAVVEDDVVIANPGASLLIYAVPAGGYKFPANTDDDWQFTRNA